MKLVEPVHPSPSCSHDPFDEVASFAARAGAADVAYGALAAREQLWCSQLFVVVLGAPAARLELLNKLLATTLPQALVDSELLPVVIHHGRVARARIHGGGMARDVALDHAADLGSDVDALELVIPSTALDPGVCLVNPFQLSAAVRGLVPRRDLALIVTDHRTSTAHELQRARELGFERGNIILTAAGSHGRTFSSSQHVVFGDTGAGWDHLRAFLRRRAEQSRPSERTSDLEIRRLIARLRCFLAERQLALEFPSTELRVLARRRAAAMARAVLDGQRNQIVDTGELARRLGTERTKFLMAVKADLLGELAELIAGVETVLPSATALAQELSAAAVFQWSELIAPLVHNRLVSMFEHHIQRLWREIDIPPDIALAAANVLVEPRSFVGRPRVGRTPRPPSRGHLGDWLRSRSGMQRRSSTVAAELLLASLETGSRALVDSYLLSVEESQRTFEVAFADALQWIADTCAEAARFGAAVRAAGSAALEDAMYQNRAHRTQLDELAQQLAP